MKKLNIILMDNGMVQMKYGNMKEVKQYMPNEDDVNGLIGEIENLKAGNV